MQDLRTERLLIRAFQSSDLPAYAKLMDDCFGPGPLPNHRAVLEYYIAGEQGRAILHQPPYGDRAILLGDELVGSVGLVPSIVPDGDLWRPEMGLFWAIAPEHRRKGYAGEAAKAMVEFAFGELNMSRLVATTEDENKASQEVMRRLGMTLHPHPEIPWWQVLGVLNNPRAKEARNDDGY